MTRPADDQLLEEQARLFDPNVSDLSHGDDGDADDGATPRIDPANSPIELELAPRPSPRATPPRAAEQPLELAFEPARPSAAPPPVASLPVANPSPVGARVTESGLPLCQDHPHLTAAWRCNGCGQGWCSKCVQQHRGVIICPTCQSPCRQLRYGDRFASQSTFIGLVPEAFGYPLRRGGILMLIAAGLFLAFGRWLGLNLFGLLILGLFLSYLAAYYMKICASTVKGEDVLPDWPDVTDIGTDVIRPGLMFIVAAAFSLAPAIAWVYTTGDMGIVPLILAIGGGIYLPMAILSMSVFRTYTAMGPHLVIPAILKVPKDYAVAIVFMIGAMAVLSFADGLLMAVNPLLGWLFSAFSSVYVMMVEMRILGLLYRTNHHRLQWVAD